MSEAPTKTAEPVTIKKYANRRLYNTGTSTYVTLEDLAAMVKSGEDFVVYDAKTGEDITRSVLTQIIFEQENKEGQNLLPIAFLRQLIRFYGDSMQMLVPRYLEVSIESLTREQEKFRQQMAQAFGGGPFTRSRSRSGATWRCSNGPLRCSRRLRGAKARAAARQSRTTCRQSGELDDLKRQLDEMQKQGRQADQRQEIGLSQALADQIRRRSLRRSQSTAARSRQARPAHLADSRSPTLREFAPPVRIAPTRQPL